MSFLPDALAAHGDRVAAVELRGKSRASLAATLFSATSGGMYRRAVGGIER
jgi:hypothetical protein